MKTLPPGDGVDREPTGVGATAGEIPSADTYHRGGG